LSVFSGCADALAGAGGPGNNPLPHKDFSIPARPFDSIFDSKARPLVGMTGDEVAYIEAKGRSRAEHHPPLRELLWIKRQILDQAGQAGASAAEIARHYGVDGRVLRRWKRELAVMPAPTFVTVQITDAETVS
jgi:hypothetical protein